jgi:hypothetical protein
MLSYYTLWCYCLLAVIMQPLSFLRSLTSIDATLTLTSEFSFLFLRKRCYLVLSACLQDELSIKEDTADLAKLVKDMLDYSDIYRRQVHSLYVRMYVCMYICMYVCRYVCMYVCM